MELPIKVERSLVLCFLYLAWRLEITELAIILEADGCLKQETKLSKMGVA